MTEAGPPIDAGAAMRAALGSSVFAMGLGLLGGGIAIAWAGQTLEAQRAEHASAIAAGDLAAASAASDAWRRTADGMAPRAALALGWAEPLEPSP